MPSITELPERLAALDSAARALVTELFHVEELEGSLEAPEPLRPKLARWCSGCSDADAEAWRRAERQRVISVHGRWTFETSNFNELRACRPISGPALASSSPDEVADVNVGSCDFCELERLTCVEPFGRVCGRHSTTAGNAFKSSGLHGLVIWHRHRPHRLTDEELRDGFETAEEWFARAGDGHRVLFWNCFRSGGASQTHPHMQLQVFPVPVADGALLLEQGARYQQATGRNLCEDLAAAHRALGLALDVSGATCWASLTPRAPGGELCALVATLAGLALAVAAMLRALRRGGVEATSMVAFALPGSVWLARCTGRGSCNPGVVDVGSAELAGLVGVGVDPYALFAALEAEVASVD